MLHKVLSLLYYILLVLSCTASLEKILKYFHKNEDDFPGSWTGLGGGGRLRDGGGGLNNPSVSPGLRNSAKREVLGIISAGQTEREVMTGGGPGPAQL